MRFCGWCGRRLVEQANAYNLVCPACHELPEICRCEPEDDQIAELRANLALLNFELNELRRDLAARLNQ